MVNLKNIVDFVEFKEKFVGVEFIVLIEYCGLIVFQFQELCNNFGFDVEYFVVKNIFFKIVVNEVGIEGFDDKLIGLIVIVFIKGEVVDVVKVIKKFVDDNKVFVVKGGYMDGNVFIVEQVVVIVELDNCEIIFVKLVGVMKGFMVKVVVVFNVFVIKMVCIVVVLQDKKVVEV